MSLSGDSHYNRIKSDRHKINNMLGFGFQHQRGCGKRCEVCQDQPKLQLKEDGGKKQWWCRGCGTYTQISDTPTNEASKFQSKYGNVAGKTQSFIISQPKRKSKEEQLQDEDRDTMAASFGSSSARLDSYEQESPP